MSSAWRPSRLGLAGGIDKDGGRAMELLTSGFGSIEFGTVTPHPEPCGNPGVAALAARLSSLKPQIEGTARIGIGVGMGGSAAETLSAEWLAGLDAAWDTADYISFNLSARRYRALLDTAHLPLLSSAFAAVVVAQQQRSASGKRHVALTLKLPLGAADAFPLTLAQAAADAGFDAVTAVLPESPQRLERLNVLASSLRSKAALVAVGGIRNAADIQAVLAAGADGVQVHTVFAQLGAACLPALLDR